MANHLANETSPYLLQHKDNPVDWYAWGNEALRRAQEEDKPILLSIGYAACHWCHVMEHESFEDAETAALMNEHFINIKVDREERPDLDAVYMEAVQAMTGHGGWPMTMFLTPEGLPFYGGTYYPPEPRHGMPSFRQVLSAVGRAWVERRDEIDRQGRQLIEHIDLSEVLKPSDAPIGEDLLGSALEGLRANFDSDCGGFGGAPKFPQPMTVDLLLRLSARGHGDAAGMARVTLDRMAAGGMFDQLAGGFARYSVDRYWIVPHFEKMLYDNGQLLRTYARAYVAFGVERFREVADMTARWLLTEMRDPAGGFWSSLDADSEGEEGRFYLFDLDEVRAVCGDDAEAAIEHFGFTAAGNFEGRNLPVRAGDPSDTAAIERARAALLVRRSERVRPGTDTKVLAGWNALTASSLAESGRLLDRPDWIEAAVVALRFVLTTLMVDGRLMRSYRGTDSGPVVKHRAYCEDYAFTLEACLALFEATGDIVWLDEARRAADEAIRLFADPAGGFFSTGSDAEVLVTRPRDLFDNALPAANSVLALELQRLAALTGRRDLEERALGAIRLLRDVIARSPQGFGHLLGAVDHYASGSLEVVIVGDRAQPDTAELVAALRSRYLPNAVLVVSDNPDSAARQIPLLEGRERLDGRATAYVCHDGTCDLPTSSPSAMLEQLGETRQR